MKLSARRHWTGTLLCLFALAVAASQETAAVEPKEPVFTPKAKISHGSRALWVFGAVLVSCLVVLAGACALVTANAKFGSLGAVLLYLGLTPLAGWMTMKFDDWWDCLFFCRMRRKVLAQAGSAEGIPVALTPGDRIVPSEGVYAWDLGWISLDNKRLNYIGDQVQFSLTRNEVSGIEIRKSASGWCRTYAVVLRTHKGPFSVRLADRGRTRRLARRLDVQLRAWWGGGANSLPAPSVNPLPPLHLPAIQHISATRDQVVWACAVRTGVLFFAAIVVFAVSPMINSSAVFAFVPFTAPLVYVGLMCPAILRPE